MKQISVCNLQLKYCSWSIWLLTIAWEVVWTVNKRVTMQFLYLTWRALLRSLNVWRIVTTWRQSSEWKNAFSMSLMRTRPERVHCSRHILSVAFQVNVAEIMLMWQTSCWQCDLGKRGTHSKGIFQKNPNCPYIYIWWRLSGKLE